MTTFFPTMLPFNFPLHQAIVRCWCLGSLVQDQLGDHPLLMKCLLHQMAGLTVQYETFFKLTNCSKIRITHLMPILLNNGVNFSVPFIQQEIDAER